MTQKRYLFDSDSLMNPHQKYYNHSIVPKFWDWILLGHQAGIFYTIDKVAGEINKGEKDDFLCKFINENPSFVLSTKDDFEYLKVYASLQNWAVDTWAKGKPAKNSAKALDEFANESKADAHLIAYAKAHNFELVSFETSDLKCTTKIKIPDAALIADIKVVNLFDVLSAHSHNNFDFK